MSQRTKAVEDLRNYFKEKGRVLNAPEYIREQDTPIRFQIVRNMFGSWARMEKIVMARNETLESITDVDDVLAARNKADAAKEALWKQASENQEKKMRREAEAQVVAEKLAANAATPEGALQNKLAIGGPLPGEQPKFERMGATVNIDPKTGERSIVDPQPELIEVSEIEDVDGVGQTPAEIKAEVEPDTGSVDTGDATGGGSSGSPSIAEAGALGGDTKTAAKTSDKK